MHSLKQTLNYVTRLNIATENKANYPADFLLLYCSQMALPMPSIGYTLRAKVLTPNTKPTWQHVPNMFNINDLQIALEKTGNSKPIQIQVQVLTNLIY